LGLINEPYQVPVIGYNLPGDIGAPKNIGEEYRWNFPNMFYACDSTFLDYFGSNGVYAIDQAAAIFNDLTNFSSYSRELDEFPLEGMRINRRAEQLHLFDLKTFTVNVMLEELGLAEADRWIWALHGRQTQPGLACPFMIYEVIKRNFDPVTWEPTSYLNGTLYTYLIIEFCTGPNPLADAYEFTVDPNAQNTLPLTSIFGVARYGSYVTGLTRDDVGGLRYLLVTNNINWERPSADSVEFVTNRNASLIISSNLSLLFAESLTNDAATLQTLFPGLPVSSSTNFFSIVWQRSPPPRAHR